MQILPNLDKQLNFYDDRYILCYHKIYIDLQNFRLPLLW